MAEKIIFVYNDMSYQQKACESCHRNDDAEVVFIKKTSDVGDIIRRYRRAKIEPVGDDDWCQSVRAQCNLPETDSGFSSTAPLTGQSSVSCEEAAATSLTTENLSEPIQVRDSSSDSNTSDGSPDDSEGTPEMPDYTATICPLSMQLTAQDMTEVEEAMVYLQHMLLYMKGPYQIDTAAAATKLESIVRSVPYTCIYPDDHPPSNIITVDPPDVNTSGLQAEQDRQVDDFNRLLQIAQTQIARMNWLN